MEKWLSDVVAHLEALAQNADVPADVRVRSALLSRPPKSGASPGVGSSDPPPGPVSDWGDPNFRI